MASRKMEICDSTSLHGEIVVSKANSTVVITQHNVQLGMSDSIRLAADDLSKFVLFLADATRGHEDEANFAGIESEQ